MKDTSDNSTRIIKDALQTHLDVVDILIKGGADVNLKDNEGRIASDFDYKPTISADKSLEENVALSAGSILPDQEL